MYWAESLVPAFFHWADACSIFSFISWAILQLSAVSLPTYWLHSDISSFPVENKLRKA